MDIDFKTFETFDELYVYCYKVASVVGLMTVEIFGYSNKEALQHAIDLGIAMQLTNILRDIGEDIDRNRIYLPLEDLRRFNYSREEFMSRTMNNKFVDLMKFQIDRARKYYASADLGIPMLEKQSSRRRHQQPQLQRHPQGYRREQLRCLHPARLPLVLPETEHPAVDLDQNHDLGLTRASFR